MHDVFAAEHEQLPRQAGSAFGSKENGLGRFLRLPRRAWPGQQHARVTLDNREHVIEIMGHACCKLADRIHLLRLAQLGFETQSVRDVLDITMHDLAGRDRVKRPRESAPEHLAFMAKFALPCVEAGLHDFIDAGRQEGAGIILTGRESQLQCGIIEISNGPIQGEFHRGIRIELREGRQFLHLTFGAISFDRHGQQSCDR